MFRVKLDNNFDLNVLKNGCITKILSINENKDLALSVYDIDANEIDENLALLSKFGFSFKKESYASSNVSFYQNFAMRFLSQRIAFSCFCHQNNEKKYLGSCEHLSDAEVIAKEENFCIRVKKPIPDIEVKEKAFSYSVKPKDIDSFMILFENKLPTQTFATAIDDMLNDIDMVVRDSSDDILSAREEYIRKLLDYPKQITYIHTPVFKNAPKIKELLLQGILPDTIVNYIFNSLTKSKEIKNIADYESIDVDGFVKTDISFDLDKLLELNKKHLEKLDTLTLAKALGHFDKDIGEMAKKLGFNNLVDIQKVVDEVFRKKDLNELELKISSLTKDKFCNSYEEYIEYLSIALGIDTKVISKSLSDIITNSVDIKVIYPYIKNYLVEIIK